MLSPLKQAASKPIPIRLSYSCDSGGKNWQPAETDAAGHQQIPTRRATRRAPPPGTAGGLRGLGAVSSHCRRLPIPP